MSVCLCVSYVCVYMCAVCVCQFLSLKPLIFGLDELEGAGTQVGPKA
jgi:hypothetical protein